MVPGESDLEKIFPIAFGILFCSVLVWFILCHRFFKILETRHPEKYESMGKPSLIMNNSISNNLSFMKFIFRKEWKQINDNGLAFLSLGMLYFIAIFSIGFLSLVIGVIAGIAP